jgi:hypothetical protein
MAAFTHAVSTASSANTTSYASGAFIPAADDLLVVDVSATGTLATGSLASSVAGKTFSEVTHAVFAGVATRYVYVSDQLASNESQTVTFDCTGDTASGAIINVERVSGITKTGLTAILQSAIQENQDTPATPETVFDAACQTGNPTLAAVSHFSADDFTPPTNWTGLGEATHGVPNHRSETAGRDSGFTGTTITWGSAYSIDGAAISLEIDASEEGGAASVGSGLKLERRKLVA